MNCNKCGQEWCGAMCHKTDRRTEPPRSPGCSTATPESIANAILGEYSVLSHDGGGIDGEHYWVDTDELATLIRQEIESR